MVRGFLTKGIGVSGFIGLFQELAAYNSVTCFIIVRFLQGLGRFSRIYLSLIRLGEFSVSIVLETYESARTYIYISDIHVESMGSDK